MNLARTILQIKDDGAYLLGFDNPPNIFCLCVVPGV